MEILYMYIKSFILTAHQSTSNFFTQNVSLMSYLLKF